MFQLQFDCLTLQLQWLQAIWATLGVGAAYVPIDPEYPAERIKHILDNAQPKLMLCREEKRQFIETAGNEVFCVENWPISSKGKSSKSSIEQIEQAPPLQLAYVIYTSGSTGKPKGVAIDHRAAANMVREQLALMNISNKDRVLQFFKPAFDGAVQEYLSTFCGGRRESAEGIGFDVVLEEVPFIQRQTRNKYQ